MSDFIQYGRGVILFLGISSAFFIGAAQLPYDNEVFLSNPTSDGKGFYFMVNAAKNVRKYPTTCDEFYNLWEAKKYSLDVDVYNNNNAYYYSHLGKCLLSRWADFSIVDVKDNIINQMDIKKITEILPAGIATVISPDDCERIELAEERHKPLSSVLHDMPLRKEQRDPERYVEFENDDGYYLRIEFYGSIQDSRLGKVYPVATFYQAGDRGTYNSSNSYLINKSGSGLFFIVHRFPELGPCH